ncbi:hypothetical protein BRADO2997 [Bradyrhizobium sp. ORS 278]|nr:hypothetical protein BRADO2997 [Bradyrhizobium sp. ORS 278]
MPVLPPARLGHAGGGSCQLVSGLISQAIGFRLEAVTDVYSGFDGGDGEIGLVASGDAGAVARRLRQRRTCRVRQRGQSRDLLHG